MADSLGAVVSALQLSFPANFGLDQIIALIVAVGALMISGFVSGSEIAFFSLTPEQCDELDETPRGKSALDLVRNPERLLATILIANNLVNVTIVILCNYALGPVFQGGVAQLPVADSHTDVPHIAVRRDIAQTDSKFRQHAVDTLRVGRCAVYDGGFQAYLFAAGQRVDDRQQGSGEEGERRDGRGAVESS